MKRRSVLFFSLGLALAIPLGAAAQTMPAAPPAAPPPPAPPPAQAPLTPAESTFYASASAAIQKLYPTPAAAEKAGYFRFTNEDRSGAISYENSKYFDTPDVSHPQQLWYDVNGRLLGGDWSQTVASAPGGPTLFGLSPSRFHKIPLHVHFALKKPDGTIEYGLYVPAAAFTAAGLDPLHPTAADLVKLGKATSPDQVAFVFALLNNWDAQMWVIPNAGGQFADLNPAVTPSANQAKAPAERQM
jgi:hypothetical protein